MNVLLDCPRALILRGNIEQELGNFDKALKLYKDVATQNIDLLPVVLHDIVACYQSSRENQPFIEPQPQKNTKFRCNNCGFLASRLQWHCPSCRQWDTSKPQEYGTL